MNTTIQNYKTSKSMASSLSNKNLITTIGMQVAARAAKLVAYKNATKNDSTPIKYYH